MGNGRGGKLSHFKLLSLLNWKWSCSTCGKELTYNGVFNHGHDWEIRKVPICTVCGKLIKNTDKLNQHFAVGDLKHREIYFQIYPTRRKTHISNTSNITGAAK